LENVEGFGDVILSNYHFGKTDSMIIISQSGTSNVIVDFAYGIKERGIPLIALTSMSQSRAAQSKHRSGKKLYELADVTFDNCAVPGDAMVRIENLHTPVGPGSTIGNTMIVNLIKCKVADQLTKNGKPPNVITSSVIVGEEESKRLFEASYEEYWQTTRNL
jgi:uncharacterized phosphosugar-binding protein